MVNIPIVNVASRVSIKPAFSWPNHSHFKSPFLEKFPLFLVSKMMGPLSHNLTIYIYIYCVVGTHLMDSRRILWHFAAFLLFCRAIGGMG